MTNVILLSHERPRLLRQCIESLYTNTPQDQLTVTVIDDDSQDFRTKKYLRSLTHKNLAVLEVQNSGHIISQLKNLGVFYSRQRFGTPEWLHIGDADSAFLPGWLNKLKWIAVTSEPRNFRLWGGQIHPYHQPINTNITLNGNTNITLNGTEMTEHAVLDGPSYFMRWQTWREIGPFSRICAPGACQSDDVEWCSRLTGMRYGYRIGVTSPHCVIHTGLTQSNGQLAPGAAERRALISPGVIAE